MKIIGNNKVMSASEEALDRFWQIRANIEQLCMFYQLPIPVVHFSELEVASDKEIFVNPSAEEGVNEYIKATELLALYFIALANTSEEYKNVVKHIISDSLLENQSIDELEDTEPPDNSQN